ncbi:uncharacterized protein LOC112517284 [Cynara cardunculus var. scolymus]|uniref:uncharacterized protein LOC112517284 n=1 Tax=Cynara cardunculus var. scolymus TaxID=59895 RepID=UPI000D627982|nr:uncharacterized protein LOC112517284 [Cynara cardunculus var. scolymus]
MRERLRKTMPELAHDCQFSGGDTTTSYSLSSNGSVSSSGFWSKHRDDVSCNQLQKFWSELSPQARQELLRVDKQTLFEQARKNMYCSRCNGLLLEGFLQIVMYGKSLQQEGIVGQVACNGCRTSNNKTIEDVCLTTKCDEDIQDPSVHPWGGLTTTRDGTLTLLDCYLYSKSLKGLQNVFGSARARERERELLYPDACGGGGRGWISQGMVGYGRGHGTRETCALHTARLSVDTLVDFWSALGEETRHSLLKMKEEDFMERLMYRFDSKRFCRDCRKNVIREFKELKELKRLRREARCTSWFCVADTSFQYEVTRDTIQADWHQNYGDSAETYHHYEWAVGTGEGKSDILEFENVGLNVRVQVNGLDLTGLNACYITLRAWKRDGRCNELSVKAHALKGQQCVHCRLLVGDGFVTITRGESIRRFFEHAEEAEEEEDDDSMDNDGNELDGECSRPQKHAKSPELAREFLLDAATVIFKEQVEKAFREGTARQNAHSIFVSLALKLLEERVLVACKDIITLEKQFKLLEEEEKEKRDEEERKERRRAKEKEKKLRRKERLRNKEKERENCQPNEVPAISNAAHEEELTSNVDDASDTINSQSKAGEDTVLSMPISQDYIEEEQNFNYDANSNADGNVSYASDHSKHSRRKSKFWDQSSKWSDRGRFAVVSESGGMVSKPDPRIHSDGFETLARSNRVNRPLRNNNIRTNIRSNGSRYGERLHCSHNKPNDRYDPHACSCYQPNDSRAKMGNKPEPDADISKPYYRGNKFNSQTDYIRENHGRLKSNVSTRDLQSAKKTWEPMETQKRYTPRNNSNSYDVTDPSRKPTDPSKGTVSVATNHENNNLKESKNTVENEINTTSLVSGTTDLCTSSNSNSDSCSSCPSEGDGNTSFSSNTQNPESSSTSDSEDASQHSEVIKETPLCLDEQQNTKEGETLRKVPLGELPSKTAQFYKNDKNDISSSLPQGNIVPPPLQAQGIHFPVFQAPSVGYYHQGPVPWVAAAANGLMPLPHPNHYLFPSPFGYGLNGNSHFLQYGVGNLQPLAPPLLNRGQPPVYQSVPQVNGTNMKEHAKVPGLQNGEKLQKVFSHQSETAASPPKSTGGQNGNSEKTRKGSTGFSLFHFGGPVALSNGKEDNSSDAGFCSIEGSHACAKDAAEVEEYNLFAASNGLRFSF